MNDLATDSGEQARRLLENIRALVRRFSLAERADMSCCGMTVAQAATLEAQRSGPTVGHHPQHPHPQSRPSRGPGAGGPRNRPRRWARPAGDPEPNRTGSRGWGPPPGRGVRRLGPQPPSDRIRNRHPHGARPAADRDPLGHREMLPGCIRPPHDGDLSVTNRWSKT